MTVNEGAGTTTVPALQGERFNGVHDYIAALTCPYCLPIEEVKIDGKMRTVVKRSGGRPVYRQFESRRAFLAHLREQHPDSHALAVAVKR